MGWLQFQGTEGDAAARPRAQVLGPALDEVAPPLVTAIAPSSYAEGSAERAVFEALNEARAKGNFGLLAQDARLDDAAARHAAYMARNLGGAISHRQQAERPGFSGETPIDRIHAAGYETSVSFEAISSGSTARAKFCGSSLEHTQIWFFGFEPLERVGFNGWCDQNFQERAFG